MNRLFIICSIALFFASPANVGAQSLGLERIKRLKKSVVRILIDDVGSGTGFFVGEGEILTCWHVIAPAVDNNKSTLSRIYTNKKISIEEEDGKKYEVMIYNGNSKNIANYLTCDYCVLNAVNVPNTSYTVLKVGRFNDVNEGDAIYSCGYPLGHKYQFISTGIVSTKFSDTGLIKFTDAVPSKKIDAAWLDITLNKGNSGGPILKLGSTPEEDMVIGYADFILSPGGEGVQQIYKIYNEKLTPVEVTFGGVNQNKVTELLAGALLNCSIGVSGCISIDYYSASR